jgi:dGTPase|tara:strand:+ start:680 stop:1822 length:1143 start_codon:yes stop_codon:yes gene_type:complete
MQSNFASSPNLSRGRLFFEAESEIRTCYQRDRDRIIHSSAFRRLKHKTQVFVEHEGDYFRTRLTHSIEVAQVARTISGVLGLNQELAESVSLAHDLGHTPFGHTGEEVLNKLMEPFGGFDHNAQALRIVTSLERHYADFDGLNLTWDCLEGIAKHNGPVKLPHPPALEEYNKLHNLELQTFASAEAQVAAISDDIAYNNHDLHDGLRAELFTDNQVAELPIVSLAYAQVDNTYKEIDPHRRRHEALRRVFGHMVEDVITTSRELLSRSGANSAPEIRNLNYSAVQFSTKKLGDLYEIKSFLFHNMYRADRIMAQREHAAKIVQDLFEIFMNSPELLPTEWGIVAQDKNHEINSARMVADYIAGMTDRFAQQKHDQLFVLR